MLLKESMSPQCKEKLMKYRDPIVDKGQNDENSSFNSVELITVKFTCKSHDCGPL